MEQCITLRGADEPATGGSVSSLRQGSLMLVAAAVLALAGCSQTPVTDATTLSGTPPSGTVEMRQVQAAYLASGSTGEGTLHYRGRDYPFRVTGLGVGGVGFSTIEAEGAVYNLQDLAQFAGVYGQGRYGFAVGRASAGDVWMRNERGVALHLRAKRTGLMLSLGGDAVKISFEQ